MLNYMSFNLAPQATAPSIRAAKRFIAIFHTIRAPNEDQRTMLAAAHYTLALQEKLSPQRAKMHLNSAITLLQNIAPSHQKSAWRSLTLNAYSKRAELTEFLKPNQNYAMALQDYLKALAVFDPKLPNETIADSDRLLLAQCAISIADLLVHDKVDESPHPLVYINKALEYLSKVQDDSEETWTTLAYAHQMAGLVLSPIDTQEATQAFRTALSIAFRTEPKTACLLLGDIYSSLGLLYEEAPQFCPIQKLPPFFSEYAEIYLNIAFFFCSHENESGFFEDHSVLNAVYETLYRALDPFLPALPASVMQDFIDALIYIYYCIVDHSLPNEILYEQLHQPDFLNTFIQHLHWLVLEYSRRDSKHARILALADPNNVEIQPDPATVMALLQRQTSKKAARKNVHFMVPCV